MNTGGNMIRVQVWNQWGAFCLCLLICVYKIAALTAENTTLRIKESSLSAAARPYRKPHVGLIGTFQLD